MRLRAQICSPITAPIFSRSLNGSGEPPMNNMRPENSPFACYAPETAKFDHDPSLMENPALRPYTYQPRPLECETEPRRPVELSEVVRAFAMQFGYP
jgi:hypothetical protein